MPVPLMTWPIVCCGADPALGVVPVWLVVDEVGLALVLVELELELELELEAPRSAGVAEADLLLAMTMAAVRRLALVATPFWPGGAPPGSGSAAPGLLGSGVETPGWFGPSHA
jgi:hypothetical protein